MSAVVVGVGDPMRGDDAVGPAVVEALRAEPASPPDVGYVTVRTPLRLADAWDGHDLAVVVDAASSGHAPGTVQVIESGATRLPVRAGSGGSHGFGVAEAVELARATGRLPARLVLVAVEADAFDLGGPMSAEVGRAVPEAVRAVLAVLRRS